MAFSVSAMYGVEVLGLITGLRDGNSLAELVNDGVGGLEPGEFKDNIFFATRHNVEEIFLCNAFYVGEEGTSKADFPVFV